VTLRNGRRTFGIVLAGLIFAVPIFSQTGAPELQQRFARESDPVRKAKIMPQLGDAEFQEIHKDIGSDHFADALAALRQYRDQARSCLKGLDATGVDAEKHSSGFRQLQISLRESLRRLDAIIPGLSSDEQSGFTEIRADLDEMSRHLIDELFPHGTRPPGKSPPPGR
jgi:hypothetical protein